MLLVLLNAELVNGQKQERFSNLTTATCSIIWVFSLIIPPCVLLDFKSSFFLFCFLFLANFLQADPVAKFTNNLREGVSVLGSGK